jgi:hypothetical protein
MRFEFADSHANSCELTQVVDLPWMRLNHILNFGLK